MTIQKIIHTLHCTALLSVTTSISAQSANTILGKWQDETDANRRMDIYQDKDGLYYGKSAAEKDKKVNTAKTALKKLKYDASSQTFKGTMNPPDADIDLNVTVSFVGNDKLKFVAKKFFMTKTIYLLRIK
jgi:hypothetical protein